jgi:hypothetical protein
LWRPGFRSCISSKQERAGQRIEPGSGIHPNRTAKGHAGIRIRIGWRAAEGEGEMIAPGQRRADTGVQSTRSLAADRLLQALNASPHRRLCREPRRRPDRCLFLTRLRHPAMSAVRSLSGGKRTSLGRPILVAIDPSETSSLIASGPVGRRLFSRWPAQSARNCTRRPLRDTKISERRRAPLVVPELSRFEGQSDSAEAF